MLKPHIFYTPGLNRQALFYDQEDFNVCIKFLRVAVKKFQTRVFAFCLMANHYHIYLSTPNVNISKFMQYINQRYAQDFLKKYQTKDGHVFKGRYRRILVEDDKYSLNLIAYVHNNPYKLKKDVKDWSYSSYASYFNEEKILDFVDYNWVLAQFSNDLKLFESFHKQMQESKWDIEEHITTKYFLGSDEFIGRIIDQHLNQELIYHEDIPGIGELKKNFDLEKINSEINKLSLDLRTKSKIEVYFLKEFANYSLKELAKQFNKTTKAISKSNIKFKKKIAEEKELQKIVHTIIRRVKV
jgi:putative transposase